MPSFCINSHPKNLIAEKYSQELCEICMEYSMDMNKLLVIQLIIVMSPTPISIEEDMAQTVTSPRHSSLLRATMPMYQNKKDQNCTTVNKMELFRYLLYRKEMLKAKVRMCFI